MTRTPATTARLSPLLVAAGVLVGACGPVELTLPAPLIVMDTFPASGATVEARHLETIAITFSEDLGEAARPTGAIVDKVRLLRHDPGEDLASGGDRVELGPPEYHRASFTVQFTQVRRTLASVATPGSTFTLLVGAGLAADSGAVLPTDARVVFWIADDGSAPGDPGEGEGEGEGEAG